ncbi:SulP family inorganic anion transporter [Spirulina sp. CS-785/01]|uniref:SLC26A/SulP transporter family protein n=1 Tax=Spirulina sp. CS-785/01 TaxID=3021716 RepID=UPI00232CE6D0|nr:SulP family inorganic anion transporter [Spirulina sp. CS-785/01]MDB9314750.1 SulP family inorganic anion transporter [Spirulina sp. CS-785/01]
MTQDATFEEEKQSQGLSPLWEMFQPQLFIPSLTAGLVTGIIGVIRAISYAALIFSGLLSTHLSTGVGMTVFSTGIITAVVALLSALPGMIATPLAAPTAILAIMAGDIAQEMKAVAPTDEILMTVLVAIAVASFLTGSFLFTLGRFQWGNAIRFVPYPVVGGFMAGTGWLLVDGFFQITCDLPITFETLPQLIEPDVFSHWGVAFLFTLTLLLAAHFIKHYFAMPGTLLALSGVFYGVIWALDIPLQEARNDGWLLGPFPQGGLWQPLGVSGLMQVDWTVILHQWGSILTVMLISLLSLLLSNSGIELVVGRDIDLNQELQAVGVASFASGVGSGMVGNQALPSTLLVNEIGGETRLTGLIAALPCVAVLLLGSSFLAYFPKPVLGCLILFLGISLLIQWVYQAWFKLPLIDYFIVWLILITINAVGFLQGIIIGFVVTVIVFMYNYSHIDVAKETLSAKDTRSNVERTGKERKSLREFGERVFILELQGFLFFGTANYLLRKVRDRIETQTLPKPEYILLDFRQVTGLDSSAVLSCSKILKLAKKHNITLVFTNLSSDFQQQLKRGEGLEIPDNACSIDPHPTCQIFSDMDRGLEWCEKQLLTPIEIPKIPFSAHLTQQFLNAEQVPPFLEYLKPQQVAADETVFKQGAASNSLFFVESGQISVLLDLEGGKSKRLQTVREGGILGEMRFYGKPPLSTAVIADNNSLLQELTRESFEQMKQHHPQLASQLEGYIIRVLCDSLTRREQQLRIIR